MVDINLTCFLGVGMVCCYTINILQDVARHRADAKANASPTRVLELKRSSGRFRRVAWSDVQVGDILLLKNRESVPADMLVRILHAIVI